MSSCFNYGGEMWTPGHWPNSYSIIYDCTRDQLRPVCSWAVSLYYFFLSLHCTLCRLKFSWATEFVRQVVNSCTIFVKKIVVRIRIYKYCYPWLDWPKKHFRSSAWCQMKQSASLTAEVTFWRNLVTTWKRKWWKLRSGMTVTTKVMIQLVS